MLGQQSFDAARQRGKQADMEAGRQEAVQALQSGGDTRGALAKLIGVGDIQGANTIAQFAEHQANRGFREQEAQRNQRNTERTIALQERALTEGRLPPGFARGPDGSMAPIPGGPADPKYVAESNAAKGKPTDNLEAEQKLRKEFEGNAKTHIEVRRGYDRILASKDDAAGDISMIFGYMRMLDPNSVVREGEFATAQNAAGIPDQVRNIYNRALEGTRLNPNQRNMFKGQAQSLYDASSREYGAREKQFRGIASKYGIDPERVIPSLGAEPSIKAAPGVSPPVSGQPAMTSTNVPWRIVQ